MPAFPTTRMRRNRRTDWSRRLVREHTLTVDDLIWPCFVHGGDAPHDIPSMPGVQRLTVDGLVQQAGRASELGVPAIAVFPVIDAVHKTLDGEHAADPDNLICRAVRAVKAAVPDIGVICDVALDPFTSHGQDGIVRDGIILNDETIEALIQQSLAQAGAGCDVIAPSDMMDGRVGAIRAALDGAGFTDTRSCPTRPSTRAPSTAPSGTPWAPKRRSGRRTSAPTSRIRPTPTRPCGRSPSTSRRARTW